MPATSKKSSFSNKFCSLAKVLNAATRLICGSWLRDCECGGWSSFNCIFTQVFESRNGHSQGLVHQSWQLAIRLANYLLSAWIILTSSCNKIPLALKRFQSGVGRFARYLVTDSKLRVQKWWSLFWRTPKPVCNSCSWARSQSNYSVELSLATRIFAINSLRASDRVVPSSSYPVSSTYTKCSNTASPCALLGRVCRRSGRSQWRTHFSRVCWLSAAGRRSSCRRQKFQTGSWKLALLNTRRGYRDSAPSPRI